MGYYYNKKRNSKKTTQRITSNDYLKYSSSELERLIENEQKNIEKIKIENEPEINRRDEWYKKLRDTEEKMNKAREEANKIPFTRDFEIQDRLFGFMSKRVEVKLTEEQLSNNKKIKELFELSKKYKSELEELRYSHRNFNIKSTSELEKKLTAMNTAIKKVLVKENKEKKNEKTKAIAANAIDKGRELADTLKNKIPKTTLCPYCNEKLTNPHLDHIYPISKGGGSSSTNLVYVCQTCNLKKSDLTLRNFIKKFDLDKERIEDTLEELGKDF